MSGDEPDAIAPVSRSRTDALQAPDSAASTAGVALDGAEAAQQAEGVAGVEAGSDVALARSIEAGSIDTDAALDALIDQVLTEQLPAGATPEVAEALREEIRTLLAEDPTVAALLKPR